MNITEVVEISILFLQIVVLIYVIYESAKMMKIENNGPFPAFFTFAMIGLLLSNMYGVIFNILRPGKRMPFAVDEIAECASILLISAGLEVIIKKYKKINIGALVFSFLFIACNIALWIVWSGEWVQDIIFGLPYIYFMYLLIIGLKNSDAVSRLEMYLAAVLSFIILIFYTINVFMTGTTKIVIDLVCVFLEFIIVGWLFAKCFFAMKHSGDEEKYLFLSITLSLCSVLIGYTNEGMIYNVTLLINTFTYILMLSAVKKNDKLSSDSGRIIRTNQ